jgi:hypothetical protein
MVSGLYRPTNAKSHSQAFVSYSQLPGIETAQTQNQGKIG